MAATDKTFVNGMLAEKARLAAQLVAEVLAEVPDDLLFKHQAVLGPAASSLQDIHHALRLSCQ